MLADVHVRPVGKLKWWGRERQRHRGGQLLKVLV
jgi:hypothetical protein